MSTPTFPAPQIDGNQGVFFFANWEHQYQTSSAGQDTFDIAYTDLVPASYGSTPNLLITSVWLAVFGVQSANGGTCFLKVERPDSDTTAYWKFLCECRDGEYSKLASYSPGIRMMHSSQNLCFQALWQAYSAGPNSFGGTSTLRFIDIQVVYTLEGV